VLDYYRLAWPILRRMDPERAHGLAVRLLRNRLVPEPRLEHDPILTTRVLGLTFDNPIGLAAGFDKNAEVVDAMLDQGFGFVEAGSVTPLPQSGNPRPRMFRLFEDRGVINRLGFNNQGVGAVVDRLQKRTHRRGVIGLNLGKNKDQPDAVVDYIEGITRLRAFADYLVVNVSSPNTPGLRLLQGRTALTELTRACRAAAETTPLLVKIAPDLADEDLADVVDVAVSQRVDGLIVGNTTLARDGLRSALSAEAGGLSGAPLFGRSTAVLRRVADLADGRLVLIGVGGISSGADAYAKIRAGASLVQLYTALVYGGVGLVVKIARDLAMLVRRDGFASVAAAVGADRH
jgi:dihydroorotate dehydrogenase